MKCDVYITMVLLASTVTYSYLHHHLKTKSIYQSVRKQHRIYLEDTSVISYLNQLSYSYYRSY
jgi:hypothetical protein